MNAARTEHCLHSMALKIGPTGGVIITHAYDGCLDSAMLSKGCTQEQLNSTRRAVKLPKKNPDDPNEIQKYSYERHSAGGNNKSQNRRSGLMLADGSFYNGRYQEGLTLDPDWLMKVKVGVQMRTLNASSAARPSPAEGTADSTSDAAGQRLADACDAIIKLQKKIAAVRTAANDLHDYSDDWKWCNTDKHQSVGLAAGAGARAATPRQSSKRPHAAMGDASTQRALPTYLGVSEDEGMYLASYAGEEVGCFNTETDAAKAHDEHACRAGKRGSELNFPKLHGELHGELICKCKGPQAPPQEGEAPATLHSGHCALRSGHCTLRSGHCTLRSGACTLRSGDCTLRSGDCTLRSGDCTLRSGNCTLRSGHAHTHLGVQV